MSDEPPDDKETRLLVGLVLVGVVALVGAVVAGGVLDSDPGSVADWLAAVSTLFALLAAAYAAFQTRGTFRLERARDKERIEQTRRAQAVQVAVWPGQMEWISASPDVVTFGPGSTVPVVLRGPGVVRPTSIPVTVLNASPVPVWHMRIEVYVGAGTAATATHAASFAVKGQENGIAVVGTVPGIEIATPEVVGDLVGVLETIPGADTAPANTWFGWSFQDNAGQWWRRFPTGKLVPLDGPPTVPGQ